MVQVRSLFSDISQKAKWWVTMETGSWKLAPILYPKAGWRPDEGGGGDGGRWVENKGFMGLVNRRAHLGFGVHFFGPQKVFAQLGSGTAPL